MEIFDFNEEQVEDIEARLSSFDENYITYTIIGDLRSNTVPEPRLIRTEQ